MVFTDKFVPKTRKANLTFSIFPLILDVWKINFPSHFAKKGGAAMTTKKKKQTYILVGLPMYAIASMLKNLHIFGSQAAAVCLTLIHYAGMLLALNGVHYFGTTYQYEKYPEESRQTVIDLNDERTRTIHDLAKARTFDIMVYMLICLPFLLIEAKSDLLGIIGSAAALLILGGSYAYYARKYSKEM